MNQNNYPPDDDIQRALMKQLVETELKEGDPQSVDRESLKLLHLRQRMEDIHRSMESLSRSH